jgi:hypothetical protein
VLLNCNNSKTTRLLSNRHRKLKNNNLLIKRTRTPAVTVNHLIAVVMKKIFNFKTMKQDLTFKLMELQ